MLITNSTKTIHLQFLQQITFKTNINKITCFHFQQQESVAENEPLNCEQV